MIIAAEHTLEPCPFCGASTDKIKIRESVSRYTFTQRYVVYCSVCHIETQSVESLNLAMQRWNRRV